MQYIAFTLQFKLLEIVIEYRRLVKFIVVLYTCSTNNNYGNYTKAASDFSKSFKVPTLLPIWHFPLNVADDSICKLPA